MLLSNGPSSFADIVDVVSVMLQIRGFGDFLTWFSWLGTPYKIGASIVGFGILYLMYLFLTAALIDNDE